VTLPRHDDSAADTVNAGDRRRSERGTRGARAYVCAEVLLLIRGTVVQDAKEWSPGSAISSSRLAPAYSFASEGSFVNPKSRSSGDLGHPRFSAG
jgi:hypothetical protein